MSNRQIIPIRPEDPEAGTARTCLMAAFVLAYDEEDLDTSLFLGETDTAEVVAAKVDANAPAMKL